METRMWQLVTDCENWALWGLKSFGIIGLLLCIGGCTVLHFVTVAIYNLTLHPLARYPGPKIAAITRLWYAYHLIAGTAAQSSFKAHEKYGPVVRIAPDEVLFSCSEAWDDIYGPRPGKPEMGKNTPFYQNPSVPHTIVNADKELHRFYRRILSRGFSEAALREQEPVLLGKIELLIQRLSDEAAKGVLPEMTEWFHFITFDIIGELAIGESFGCLEDASYHPWVKLIFDVVKLAGIGQALGYYPSLFKVLMRFVPKSLNEKFAAHDKLSREQVQRRLDSKVDCNDLTSNLFKPENNLERYQIDGNCKAIMVGGSESTATVLSAATYYLGQNRQVMAKAIQEVRGSFSSAQEINCTSVNKLKYLLACLTEAMRKFPPTPQAMSRRVPKCGALINGNWIPGGMLAGVSIFCANNSSLNFRDSGSFIPERWIDNSAYANDDRHAMQAFSYGPRNCIGQNLALIEIRLILAHLIWEFDWDLASGMEKWDETHAYVHWDKKPLKVCLKRVAR